MWKGVVRVMGTSKGQPGTTHSRGHYHLGGLWPKIKPVHPKGNQSWISIGRTDAEAETPILWPPDAKNWLIGKDPDAGKDRKEEEEKGRTENETVGWHHRLDGHEFEQAPGVGDGQGGLACCDSRGCKESDMTERLNWPEQTQKIGICGQKWRYLN